MATPPFQAKIRAVEQAVLHACAIYGVAPPLVKWSKGMTAAAGKATRKEVRFSIPLFETADIAFCLETGVHEAAHYIEFQKFGTSSHGKRWKSIMASLGYPNAQRCHQQDRSHLVKYQLICRNCQKVLRDYTKRPTLSLSNKVSICCKSSLILQDIRGNHLLSGHQKAKYALKCKSCKGILRRYLRKPFWRLDNKISTCCHAKIHIEKLDLPA